MRNKISVHHACRTHLFPDKYIYGLNRTFSLLLNCGYIVSLCRVYVWFSQSDSPWKQEGPKRENRCIYPISLGKFLPKTHFSTSFLPKSWSHSHLLFVSPSPSDPNSTFPVKQNRQLPVTPSGQSNKYQFMGNSGLQNRTDHNIFQETLLSNWLGKWKPWVKLECSHYFF